MEEGQSHILKCLTPAINISRTLLVYGKSSLHYSTTVKGSLRGQAIATTTTSLGEEDGLCRTTNVVR